MLDEADEKQAEELFFRLWTAKESYLKLTGQGITAGMDGFRADLSQGVILDAGDGSKKAYIKEYHPLEDYFITAAAGEKDFLVLTKRIYYRI
jgi:4'-phosphopantetheinyl transferase